VFETARALESAGVKPELLYLGNLRSPSQIAQAQRLLKVEARSYDVVHAQFGSACGWLVSRLEGPAKVVTFRGSDWTPAVASSRRMQAHAALATWFSRQSISGFDHVVAVSHRIREEVLAFSSGATVSVCPSAIDFSKFTPSDQSAARLRLGLKPTPVRYVLFTTFAPGARHKRPELAAASVEELRLSVPQVELLLATGFPHDRMPDVVNAADVVLCTSVAEGWPNSVKEALACGLPFVSTDVSDLAAISAVDRGCFVVDPDPSVIALALEKALEHGRDAARRCHLEAMKGASVADELLKVYHAVLNVRHPE
jgi:teichuronic acid biosynthesis glycosyltransferase TuaC